MKIVVKVTINKEIVYIQEEEQDMKRNFLNLTEHKINSGPRQNSAEL